MKEIAKALLQAQTEMSNPVKGSTNPFFKSKYADLNAVREAVIPTLNKYGIIVLQPMESIEGKNYIKTVLMHESGDHLEGFTEIIYAKQNDAQAQGSGITYARRYGLQSMVCVGADDDDGNSASHPMAKPTTPPSKKEPPKKAEIDDLVKAALGEINKQKDLDGIMEVWKSFPNLQSNKAFKDACTAARKKLEKK